MPIRMLRDWTDSDKVNSLKSDTERFYIRLIMKADDFGRYVADERLLRASLFPLLLNEVREADITRWMAACQKASLIRLYEVDNKRYLEILNYGQRVDKARAKYPLPPAGENISLPVVVREVPGNSGNAPAEYEYENEKNTNLSPNGESVPQGKEKSKIFQVSKENAAVKAWAALVPNLPADSRERKTALGEFIRQHRPDFIEPYATLWNIFAAENNLSQIQQLTEKRKKKIKLRAREEFFDFVDCLVAIKKSAFAKGDNNRGWKVDFDFLIESESNYVKILEGKFEN